MADQKTTRGFGSLPCPLCGADASCTVSLDDLQTFTCCECEETFSREQVEDFISRWSKVLLWLDSAPVVS